MPNARPPIVVEYLFSFTLNLRDGNRRERGAVVNADGWNNGNVQGKKIAQASSVSTPNDRFWNVVTSFTHTFGDSIDGHFYCGEPEKVHGDTISHPTPFNVRSTITPCCQCDFKRKACAICYQLIDSLKQEL